MSDRHRTSQQLVWSPELMVKAINERLFGVVDILEHILANEDRVELLVAAKEARARYFEFESAWQRFSALVRTARREPK